MKTSLGFRSYRLCVISLLLTAQFCGWGCKNPFKTRSSPPPVVTQGTWETPAEPKIVLQNLLHAYAERIMVNFAQCLSDSFRFSAPEDSVDAVNQGRADLFAQWDRSAEISVTTNIFSTFSPNNDSLSYVLSFQSIPPVPDDITDTVAVLSRNYELSVLNLTSTPPETTLVKGTATFYMKQSFLSWWSIYFWSDIQASPGNDDWADFKARFRK
ncbi:MAG: hypothetical protein WCE90_13310 [Candidatus Zixiibacteriota bacterium]